MTKDVLWSTVSDVVVVMVVNATKTAVAITMKIERFRSWGDTMVMRFIVRNYVDTLNLSFELSNEDIDNIVARWTMTQRSIDEVVNEYLLFIKSKRKERSQ